MKAPIATVTPVRRKRAPYTEWQSLMQATAKAKTRRYRVTETERMRELEGLELASFQARGAALLLTWWLLWAAVAVYREWKDDREESVGIRVMSLVHHRMSLWHCIERALGYGASTLEFGFRFVQYYVHPNRRTVHDRTAETIVVRDR